MVIPRIYKGDSTDFMGTEWFNVRISAAESLAGCEVEVSLLGVTRRFPVVAGRETVCPFPLSAKETAAMPLGVHVAKVRLVDQQGRVRTVLDSLRVKVVGSVAEAYGADAAQELAIDISNAAALPAIPAELRATDGDSLGEVKDKINQVIDILGGAK